MADTHNHDEDHDDSMALPALVILGMGAGLAAHFAGRHDLDLWGYGVVYLAGGIPSGLEALRSLTTPANGALTSVR